jgi:ribosomal protein S21
VNEEVRCSTKVRAGVILRKGEDIDVALRRLKKKVDRANILEDAYWNSFYLRPCIAKREKRKNRRKSYE